jgi:Zn-dependent peptidase ImmA (M78 family)
LRRPKDLENETISLLERYAIKRPPIAVELLAAKLGIDVRYSPGKEDVSGALIRSEDSVVIAVNSAQHENRQRFTIAHEIGHFVLHEGTRIHFDEDFRVNYRNALSSEATNLDEIEANRFAAALLMPADPLRRDLLKLNPNEHNLEMTIQSLSVRYKVSSKAMELRLVNLGYVSPVA